MYYSLQMIIAIGFRVRGVRGTQFRQWANAMLQCMIRNCNTTTPQLEYISRKLYLHEQQILSINQRIDEMVQLLEEKKMKQWNGILEEKKQWIKKKSKQTY